MRRRQPLEQRQLRPTSGTEDPNSNDPLTVPPATVGVNVVTPGDPEGLVFEGDSTGPPWPRSTIVPSVWSGWPAEWNTPNWWGRVSTLTDTAWTCLDLNSSLLATMPPYLVGASPTLPDDWLDNPDPDKYASWEEFAKQLFWDYQLGEVFVLATARYANGFPARFHVVSPWLVDVDFRAGRRVYSIGRLDVTADMLHIRYQGSTDDAHGHGPLEAGSSRLIAATVLARYATNMASAGGIPNAVLVHPDELTADQATELQSQWVTARMSSLGLPAVLSGGITFETLQFSPTDMALLELSQFNDSRIAVMLGVPPFLVGLPSGGDSMCVDTETEILTLRGWKPYDELIIGEHVYALDMETGMACWEPLLDVQTFDVTDRAMVGIEMQGHSSFSTDDHRWPVKRNDAIEICMSRDLRRHDRLIMTAPRSDAPVEAKYTDAFVELVAWLYTEGHISHGAVWIAQNERVNPHHCDRIRAALRAYCGTSWSEYHSDPRGGLTFRLPPWASKGLVQIVGPGKCPPFDFINALTTAQLDLFIAVSVWADGCESGGQVTFKQHDNARMESFEMACLLAGRSTMRHSGGLEVTVRRRADVVPRDADLRAKRVGRTPIIRHEQWTGRVWCPTTPLGTWMARRHGTAYFTHNTYSNTVSLFDYHWRAGLRPKAQAVMAGLSAWLTPRGTRVEVNRDAYVQPGPLERAQTWQILIDIGVLTAEQVQAIERYAAGDPAAFETTGVL